MCFRKVLRWSPLQSRPGFQQVRMFPFYLVGNLNTLVVPKMQVEVPTEINSLWGKPTVEQGRARPSLLPQRSQTAWSVLCRRHGQRCQIPSKEACRYRPARNVFLWESGSKPGSMFKATLDFCFEQVRNTKMPAAEIRETEMHRNNGHSAVSMRSTKPNYAAPRCDIALCSTC